MIYEISKGNLVEHKKEITNNSKNLICIYNSEEAKKNVFDIPINNDRVHFCKIEDTDKYMYGNLCIPKKDKYPENITLKFYIVDNNIIFIDDSTFVNDIINEIIAKQNNNIDSIMKFINEFLKQIIKNDLMYLEKLEQKLSNLEKQLLGNSDKDFSKRIYNSKKEILKYYHYYGQLLDLGDTLIDNIVEYENIFDIFMDRTSRLRDETLLLREYTHQLQDLYESQINLKQNNVMRVLTVVTLLFSPLTLITSWYGMNFDNMPELYWDYGYPMVMVLSIFVIIVCLFIFKRKKFW